MSLFDHKKEEISLLVDIGNGNITGAFVLLSKDQLPKFLHTVKTEFVVSDKPDAMKLLDTMNRVLDDTLSYMMKYGFEHNYWKYKDKKLNNALITFSSPWFIAKTKHIHLSQDKFFIISENFLKDIRDKEEEIFKKELTRQFHIDDSDSFEVIEKSIVHIKINGYSVENSIGSKTKIFDAYLCMSVINESVIKKVYNTVLKNTSIPKERVLTHSFPLISFSVLRDIFVDHSNFLIMDITGEVTDITLVQNDVIVGTTSFPYGRNNVIRKISYLFSLPTEVAESTFHLYLSKKLDEAMSKQIENLMGEIEKEWFGYFESSILELSPEMILPRRTYVTANFDVASLYINFLKSPRVGVTSSFRKKLDIVHINESVLSGFYTKNSLIQTDEFIVLLAIFYNKIIKQEL